MHTVRFRAYRLPTQARPEYSKLHSMKKSWEEAGWGLPLEGSGRGRWRKPRGSPGEMEGLDVGGGCVSTHFDIDH